MSEQTEFPTMEELMARVGYLLLHWGWLENDVREAGKRVSSLSDDPDLAFARDIRNLISHGMYGASADAIRWSEPYLMCRSAEGEEVKVTFSDMGAAMDVINAHRNVVRRSRDGH